MKTAKKQQKKPTPPRPKLRDLPAKKNPKGGVGGVHLGPSGPGG